MDYCFYGNDIWGMRGKKSEGISKNIRLSNHLGFGLKIKKGHRCDPFLFVYSLQFYFYFYGAKAVNDAAPTIVEAVTAVVRVFPAKSATPLTLNPTIANCANARPVQ